MRPRIGREVEEHEFAQEGRNCSLTSDLAKFALRIAWRFQVTRGDLGGLFSGGCPSKPSI